MKKSNHIFFHRWFSWIFGILILFCLAQSLLAEIRHQFDVRITMRDGIELSADIWMPASGGRYPAILIRTPYIKTTPRHRFPEFGEYFASKGYVFIVQDVRGRGDSDGEFNFFFGEGEDGYDTIEWIAKQPWSNGRVGMMGASYWATVQWLAAREKPPHLVCIVPTASAGRYFDEVPYSGGAFMIGWALHWINDTSGRISQSPNASKLDWESILKHRPLITLDEIMGRSMRLYRKFLEHPTLDSYWKRISFTPEDFRKIDLPSLHVTGWFDGDQPGALFYWEGMVNYSPAKDKQFLLVGPWTHKQTFMGGSLKVGEIELGGDSVIDNKALHLAFFEHYLKRSDSSFDFPRVRIYITGSNKWREFNEYPPSQVKYRRFYLHSEGKANTLAGDGRLDWNPPLDEIPDRYIYNPKNPVPSDIGGESLAVDHRIIQRRDDVLVYTSDKLQEPLEVIGRIFVILYATSDVFDTDFTANILDVYPDGRSVKLGPREAGIIRTRYRKGYERMELLTPNTPEKFRIELFDIGHTFLAGHRIQIEISSSAFPFVNPNQNTGKPIASDTEWKFANQTIFHDSKRPSHILLPVMPKEFRKN